MLAVRLRGDAPRDRRVVLQDHRVRGGAARVVRPAARLARARAHDAAELDRQERRRRVRLEGRGTSGSLDPRLHHAAGHRLRHDVRGAGPRAPARRSHPHRRRRARGRRAIPRRGVATVGDRADRRGSAQARAPSHGESRQPVQLGRDPAVPRRLRADGLRHRRDHGGARRRRARLGVRRAARAADRRDGQAPVRLDGQGVYR